MKKGLFVLILGALAAWIWWPEAKADWRGMPARKDPVQTDTKLPKSFRHGQYTITPLANYYIEAVVLSRERYRYDPVSDIGPLDLALGWGPMSMAAVINELNVSQSGRWYEYSWKNEPPLDPDLIATNSANTHCLPASPSVRAELLNVKRHEIVKLSGLLVEVNADDGGHWRSSLSRTDTGGGACEVFWVTGIDRSTPTH